MNYKLFIAALLLFVASPMLVSAENITCYSPITQAWYSSSLDSCEYKLFSSTDLVIITANFDSANCTFSNIYCSGSDINKDGVVNGTDLRLLTPSLCVENCTIYPVCTDAVCELGENCSTCSADCGTCPAPPKEKKKSSGGGGGSKLKSPIINNATNEISTSEGKLTLNITEPLTSDNSELGEVLSNSSSQESFLNSENLLSEENASQEDTGNAGNALTGMVTGGDFKSGSLKTLLIVLVSLLVVVLGAVGYIVVKKKRRNLED
jgi:hypothetical protein